MEKRSNFVLDNAINAYEHTADSALDRCTLDFLKELRDYRKLEEQGLLLRLPCKVGDSIYSVIEDGLTIVELKFSLDFYARRKNDIGKTVFLTREEAEKALADMGV